MGLTFSPTQLLFLLVAAFAAGFVDAIAGGGGLISLPALMAVGLPPHAALATNKGQSVFGATASLTGYARAGLVDRRRALLGFPAGFLGALLGARLVLLVRPETLRPIVVVLLLCVVAFLSLRPNLGEDGVRVPRGTRRIVLIALVMGLYDGFFGPGVGTFLIIALVALVGLDLARASAEAKVVNFASNLAAVILFGSRGLVLWSIALPMAFAQFCGGWLGARFAIRRGSRVVRGMVMLVAIALALKLGQDMLAG